MRLFRVCEPQLLQRDITVQIKDCSRNSGRSLGDIAPLACDETVCSLASWSVFWSRVIKYVGYVEGGGGGRPQ